MHLRNPGLGTHFIVIIIATAQKWAAAARLEEGLQGAHDFQYIIEFDGGKGEKERERERRYFQPDKLPNNASPKRDFKIV